MSQAAAVEAREIPVAETKPRVEPTRLRPDQKDALVEAVWDLQARCRRHLDHNRVLEWFIEEEFGGWLDRKLAAPGRLRRARRRERAGDEGDEG